MSNVYEKQTELNTKNVVVSVAEDHMSASIVLGSIGQDGSYTYEEVIEKLSAAGVLTGIDAGKIRDVILKKIYEIDVTVAEGKPAVNGENGHYIFHFDENYERDNKPTLREDGSVDYFNVKLFEKVSSGDMLAEYIEPTKGEFGYDVCGKLLVPKPGRPSPRLRGKGFTVSDDGNTYYAQIDGKVEYRNYDLNVSSVYSVSGDLDGSNIDFNGDVTIDGGVYSGVTVNAMGNIFIGGYVEDAVLKAGKDIIIKDGVNAKTNGYIEAGGNISARFFENARVISHGDIKCDYMLNTNATAYGNVYLEGKLGSVIGGDVTGVRGITVKSCGSDAFAKTIIRVGATQNINTEYAQIIMKIKEIDSEIERYDQALYKLDILKNAKSDKFDEVLHRKVFQTKIVKKAEKASYEEQGRYLYSLIKESERAVVKIDKNIYPGSRVFMGDKKYVTSSVFTHIALKKTSSGIIIRNFDSM